MVRSSLLYPTAALPYFGLPGHLGRQPAGRVQQAASPQNANTNGSNSRNQCSFAPVSAPGNSLSRPTTSRGPTHRPVTRSITRRDSSNGNPVGSQRRSRAIIEIESKED